MAGFSSPGLSLDALQQWGESGADTAPLADQPSVTPTGDEPAAAPVGVSIDTLSFDQPTQSEVVSEPSPLAPVSEPSPSSPPLGSTAPALEVDPSPHPLDEPPVIRVHEVERIIHMLDAYRALEDSDKTGVLALLVGGTVTTTVEADVIMELLTADPVRVEAVRTLTALLPLDETDRAFAIMDTPEPVVTMIATQLSQLTGTTVPTTPYHESCKQVVYALRAMEPTQARQITAGATFILTPQP